jgi:Txe/YoeB family toxin of Txe-Axe toxin-antitoxin module
MTKEEIVKELQHRATQKYLIYLALQEIMLDNYEDCKFLKDYDFYITNKHKNLIADLKRNATKAFRFLQGYEEGEKTIKQFHEFVTLFERLHDSIDQGGSLFHDCLNAIEQILNDHEGTKSN